MKRKIVVLFTLKYILFVYVAYDEERSVSVLRVLVITLTYTQV